MDFKRTKDCSGEFSLLEAAETMNVPAVSVLMSVFNGEAFLRESVESILNQKYRDFEFIITDDGSEDSSLEILREYAVSDKRIRLVSQKNMGLTKSLNRMFALSRGGYIARQDADDRSHPDRFEKQVETLDENPGAGLCGVYSWIAGADGIPVFAYLHESDRESIREVIRSGYNVFQHGSVMMRRNVLEKFEGPYRFYYGQDFDLWMRMAQKNEFIFVPEPLYVYRRLDTSISGSLGAGRAAIIDLMIRLAKEREAKGREESDWHEEEKAIMDSLKNSVSGNSGKGKSSCISGYMKLLSGRRCDAFRTLAKNSDCPKSLIMLFLSLLPFGTTLARRIHTVSQPRKLKIKWASREDIF